jgi:phospholipid transport system transporter-binding protein
VQLPAATTLDQAPELLRQLEQGLSAAGSGPLRIDAAAMKEFDTSALALLLEASRRARQQGGTLVVDGAPPKLIELARLYGVDELLPLTLPPA